MGRRWGCPHITSNQPLGLDFHMKIIQPLLILISQNNGFTLSYCNYSILQSHLDIPSTLYQYGCAALH